MLSCAIGIQGPCCDRLGLLLPTSSDFASSPQQKRCEECGNEALAPAYYRSVLPHLRRKACGRTGSARICDPPIRSRALPPGADLRRLTVKTHPSCSLLQASDLLRLAKLASSPGITRATALKSKSILLNPLGIIVRAHHPFHPPSSTVPSSPAQRATLHLPLFGGRNGSSLTAVQICCDSPPRA